MTDICTIGPVSIENAHLFDNNTFEFTNSATRVVSSGSTITTKGQYGEMYAFELICTYDEALQLKGLVEMGEMVWMNTSDLTDNDYLQHKGWVLLTSLVLDLENPELANCKIEYIKISDHEAEYLTMDYSRGIYDGINITPTYDITQKVYQIQEDGSDATTNWTSSNRYPTSGTNNWGTDGTEFTLQTASAVDGRWQNTWVRIDTKKFTPPFTVDLVLDRRTLPASGAYPAALGIMFSPNALTSGTKEFQDKKLGDYLEVQWNLQNTSTNLHVAEVAKGGSAKFLRSNVSLGTGASFEDIGVRIIFYADGKIRVYYDDDITFASPTQIYYGPSNLINYKNGVWLYLMSKNKDSTSWTGSVHYVDIYNENTLSYPNIVMTPPDAVLSTAATGTRTVEDGTASYYANPTTELRYLIDKSKYYQGSVKLLSSNNATSTSRQVFGTGIKLTPTTTILKNGMTQLTFDADEVILSGWASGAYHEINRFEYTADIDLIRPLFVNSERVVLQINDTKWTMLRSSPVVTVEHPNTDFDYALKDRYYLPSGLVSSPGASATIDMTADTDYYCNVYNNASDTYQLLIVKRDPTTIKSDNLPADNVTGLGWFLKSAGGYNAADSLARQWYKQTRTGISMKQII